MPSENAPFGFMPVRTRSGAKQPQYEIREGAIPSGYGTAIYTNQMVKLATGGTIQPAAAGDAVLGTFAGCEFVDSDGRPRVLPYWPASQTILSGTSVKVYYYSAQDTVYRVQADGTLAITSVGDQADLSNATDANTTTGLSQQTLSTSVVGAGNNAQFRILQLGTDVDNDWGDTYVIVDVEISEHQYTADKAAI